MFIYGGMWAPGEELPSPKTSVSCRSGDTEKESGSLCVTARGDFRAVVIKDKTNVTLLC